MERKLIGLVGFIGSGKGTVGDYLNMEQNFTPVSFAESLKDAVSAIFGWPRDMIEGSTEKSRIWREQVDVYWSQKLGKDVTPRWVLQHIGTDILRNKFLDDIWIASLEKKLKGRNDDFVITDVRFPNEIKMIYEIGGEIWWVKRGKLPEWYDLAITNQDQMPIQYPNIHSSEYKWLGQGNFIEIYNDKDLDYLFDQVNTRLIK